MSKFKLTDKSGCAFNDRILIEFSPFDLEDVVQRYRKLAETSNDYSQQSLFHELHDKYYDILQEYRTERDKFEVSNE